MAVDIAFLEKAYFYFDKPVLYITRKKKTIPIYPVSVSDYEIFMSSVDILQFDKNLSSSVEIIQMSYLEFLMSVILQIDKNEVMADKVRNIMSLCLKWDNWSVSFDSTNKPFIINTDNSDIISTKDFDDIKRIILYQNLLGYTDEYIDPDLKKSIEETDKLRLRDIELPSIERKMSIITAHCGLSKKDQMAMTMRAHESLFEECVAEINYTTTRPIALYAGKANEIEWIYKKKKDKYSDYIMTIEDYNKSMGGDGKVADGKFRASKNVPQDGATLDAMYNMNTTQND